MFSCESESNEFKRLVPSEHRTQVLHHCATIGVNFVLYTKFSVHEALYTVVVHFEENILQSYRNRLSFAVDQHLIWLYRKQLVLPTAEEMTIPIRRKKTINGQTVIIEEHEPYFGYTQDRHGYCYYVRCWRAIDMMVRGLGAPLKGGFSWAPGPHAMWPKQKPLLDVVSRYITHIEAGRDSNLTLSQSLASRMILYQLYNAYVCHRVLQTIDRLKDGWKLVLKNQLSASHVLKMRKTDWAEDSILQIVTNISDTVSADPRALMPEDLFDGQLRIPSSVASGQGASATVASASGAAVARRPKRNCVSWASGPEGKRPRLNKTNRHLPVQALSKARNCALCAGSRVSDERKKVRFGWQTTYVCSECDLPLCTSTKGNDRRTTSCFQKWHSTERLQKPGP